MKHDIYFLYSDPAEGSRTGHAAIAVLRDGKIARYFSMYHAILPDKLRHLSVTARFTRSIESHFVDSYEDDVVMRGQSKVRFEKQEKENISVPDILKNLRQLDSDTRAHYFNLGQFHHALKLPNELFNPFLLVESLDQISDIRNSIAWAMCSPFTRFFFDAKAYNCCSAIVQALMVSGKDELNAGAQLVLVIARVFFVACAAAYSFRLTENQDNAFLNYLPMLYSLLLALLSIYHAYHYVQDLKAMAKKDGPDFKTLSAVYIFCMVVNIVGSPFSDNACAALFLFPGALARSLSAVSGVQKLSELPTIFMRTPKTKQEEVAPQRALVV